MKCGPKGKGGKSRQKASSRLTVRHSMGLPASGCAAMYPKPAADRRGTWCRERRVSAIRRARNVGARKRHPHILRALHIVPVVAQSRVRPRP